VFHVLLSFLLQLDWHLPACAESNRKWATRKGSELRSSTPWLIPLGATFVSVSGQL
jgi:hypothetical protein